MTELAETREAFPDGLPPGAVKLVQAGKQLLIEGGMDALSVANITAAAGQNRAMVNYYFGSKAAMVAVIVDSLIHEAVEELVAETEALPRGESRIGVHLEKTLELMRTPEFLATIDVIPSARRNTDLRERLAKLYEWYREKNAECIDPAFDRAKSRRAHGLATLYVAMFDGLAIQWALDSEAVDFGEVADLIKDMFSYMAGSEAGQKRAGRTAAEDS